MEDLTFFFFRFPERKRTKKKICIPEALYKPKTCTPQDLGTRNVGSPENCFGIRAGLQDGSDIVCRASKTIVWNPGGAGKDVGSPGMKKGILWK